MNDNSFLDGLPHLSESESKVVLKHLKSKFFEDKRTRFLEYKVNPTGSNKLVVGNNSTTWISLSSEIENKISYFLEDDEGTFELDHFDLTLDGLNQCLECLYQQQDEVSLRIFQNNIKLFLSHINHG